MDAMLGVGALSALYEPGEPERRIVAPEACAYTVFDTESTEPRSTRRTAFPPRPLREQNLQYGPGRTLSADCGGDEETRTPDPLRAKQVLFQLSYAPTGSKR